MRRARFRAIGLATTIVVTLAVPTATVRADTFMVIEFIADVTLDGGMGNACFPNLPCPPEPTLVNDLPLHGDIVPANFHTQWDDGHNGRNVTVQNVACADLAFNDKPDKAPFHEGFCNFGTINIGKPGTNTVSGYCESAGGQVALFFVDALGQTFFFDLHFDTLGTTLVFTGHWYKRSYTFPTQRGLILGEGEIVPDPTHSDESCLTKTARHFIMHGMSVLVTTPL